MFNDEIKGNNGGTLKPFKKKADMTPEELAQREAMDAKAADKRRETLAARREVEKMAKALREHPEELIEGAMAAALINNPDFMEKAMERMQNIVLNGNDREAITAMNALLANAGMAKPKKQEVTQKQDLSGEEALNFLKSDSAKVVNLREVTDDEDATE